MHYNLKHLTANLSTLMVFLMVSLSSSNFCEPSALTVIHDTQPLGCSLTSLNQLYQMLQYFTLKYTVYAVIFEGLIFCGTDASLKDFVV